MAGDLTMTTCTTISLLELGPVTFGGIDGIISFLQGKGRLAQQKTCHHCLVPMNIARRASLTDGRAFWCPQCHTYHKLETRELLCKISVATAEVATANVSVGERVSHKRCPRGG